MIKEILENKIDEVTLSRKTNDAGIKQSIKTIRDEIKDVEKRLKAIEKGNFDDMTANAIRGDLRVSEGKFQAYFIPTV